MVGQAVDRRVAASVYVWLGLLRAVRGFRVKTAAKELLDSERVDDGEDEFECLLEVLDEDDDLTMFSRSNL